MDSMLEKLTASTDSLCMDVEEELSNSACIRAVLRELTYPEPLDEEPGDQTEHTSPLLQLAVASIANEQATLTVDGHLKNAADQNSPTLLEPVDASVVVWPPRSLRVKDLDEQQQQTQGKNSEEQKGASKRTQPGDEKEDHPPSKKSKKSMKKEPRTKQQKLQKKLNIKPCTSKVTCRLGRKTTSKSVVRSFSLVRDAEEAKLAGFIYRKMWVADIPIITEGYGLSMLKDVGLDGFLLQPIPSLNKKFCDEFLLSFDHTTSSGIVDGRIVKLDAQSVAAATKLPIGAASDAAAVAISFYTTEQSSALKRMLMNVNEKRSRGYDLGQLVYGEDVDVVAAIASGLMMKLECKRECFHYVTPEILLAIDKSIREGMQMQWAPHMAQLMSRAAKKSKAALPRIAYQYGEWLTKIIEYAMEAECSASALASSGEQRISEPSPCACNLAVVASPQLALQQGMGKQVVEVGVQTEGGISSLLEQRQVQRPESIGSKLELKEHLQQGMGIEVGVQDNDLHELRQVQLEAINSKLEANEIDVKSKDMEIQRLRADLAAEKLQRQRLQADMATETLERRALQIKLAVMRTREGETMETFRETFFAYVNLKKRNKRLQNALKALKREDQGSLSG